jgi:hypothetical protein
MAQIPDKDILRASLTTSGPCQVAQEAARGLACFGRASKLSSFLCVPIPSLCLPHSVCASPAILLPSRSLPWPSSLLRNVNSLIVHSAHTTHLCFSPSGRPCLCRKLYMTRSAYSSQIPATLHKHLRPDLFSPTTSTWATILYCNTRTNLHFHFPGPV